MPIASRKPLELATDGSAPLKPRWRGWIHLAATPLSLAASIVLVVLAPTTGLKWASAVYLASSFILFGLSAAYHLFYWKPSIELVLKRLDHANIFLLIAGTYTPLTVAMLHGNQRVLLLSLVWGGALIGILIVLGFLTMVAGGGSLNLRRRSRSRRR